MKKWKRNILMVISFYISFCLAGVIVSLTSLKGTISIIIFFLIFILPIIIYNFIIKRIINKENEVVSKTSKKIQKITKLNESYQFKDIKRKKRNIIEREYSRKSLDRVTGKSIINYHLDNNINGIRTDLENAIFNITLLEKYNKDVEKVLQSESTNNSKYSSKKFKMVEERVLRSIIYKKENFMITLKIEVYYRSNGGKKIFV